MFKTAMTDNPFFRSTTSPDPSSSNPVDPLAGGSQTQPPTSASSDLPGAQPVAPPVVPENADAPLNDLSQAISSEPTMTTAPIIDKEETALNSVPLVSTIETSLPATDSTTQPNALEPVNNLTEPITPAQPPIPESIQNVPTIPEMLAVPQATQTAASVPAIEEVPVTPVLNSAIETESVSAAPILNPPVDTPPDMDTPPEANVLETSGEGNMLSRASESSVADDDVASKPLVSEQANPTTELTPTPLAATIAPEAQVNVEPIMAPLASSISETPSTPGPIQIESQVQNPAASIMPQSADSNVSPVVGSTVTLEQPLPSPTETPATVTSPEIPQMPVAPIAESLAPVVPESLPPIMDTANTTQEKPAASTPTTATPADGKMKNLLLLLGLLVVGIIALVLGIIVASSQ